ncbi:DUF2955 domain-containing protein [Psychromonas sp. L1A2]|uniref:DUF2955 domain-containing protein n=1 Tax=Psychromonas sp. L1A2 TaxID=2686356 RepID=UPI0013599C94|nr:DUF2955 domain-containing protein [Psychromonas sp. L1A2]
MLANQRPLTANDLRQCIRITTGATIGFTLCKIFDWHYGVFFTVTPMLLLGFVPVMNMQAMKQIIAASTMAILEVGLLTSLLGGSPGMMLPIVFCLFLYRFAAMSKGSLFLFGAYGVLMLSIMLHYASYPNTNLNDLLFSNFWATILSVFIAYLMTILCPDVAPRTPPTPGIKAPHRMRHETLLGATIATMSFIVFQVLDLQDSMSAQASTILILFPMHWNGVIDYARKRAIGTILGVSVGISLQFLLYEWSSMLLLVIPLLWISLLLFSQFHVREGGGSSIGFGAMTTLGILFGQYLTPNNDLIFSAFYRISSIAVAIVLTLFLCRAIHQLLNRFEATRFGY